MDVFLVLLLLAGIGRLVLWAVLWKTCSKDQALHPIYSERKVKN
jgi:hypothetical protein